MFIRYGNTLYHFIKFFGKEMITTHDKQKTDDSFYLVSDYYAKDYNPRDKEIQDIYEADFYVVYHDTSETVKEAMKYAYEGSGMLDCDQRAVKEGIWCVNEGIPRRCTPKIENDEVGIGLAQWSYSEDWVQFDRSSISKIVNIHECSRLMGIQEREALLEVFRSIAHHFERTRFGRGRAGERPFTMEKKCLRKAEKMLGVSKIVSLN